MPLTLKPDFENAQRYWRAFWNREIIDRPCIAIRAKKDGAPEVKGPIYLEGADGDIDGPVSRMQAWSETIFWGGEAIPFYCPSFGPDQFSFFVGADVKWSADSNSTNWAVPFVKDWENFLPLKIDQNSVLWQRMLKLCRAMAKAGDGKFLVANLDWHSNTDCLAAIRSPSQLCLDMIEMPEVIDRAMRNVRELYAPLYSAVYEAGNMGQWGSSSWCAFYCEGKVSVIQCDFCTMVSPQMFRRFILPALEDETNFLDHAIYHLDGVGALAHLDDLLSLPRLDVIQWVPGAGQPGLTHWMDVFKRIQKAGKGIHMYCGADEIKFVHKNLRPEGVFYDTWAKTEKEAVEMMEWLVKNT